MRAIATLLPFLFTSMLVHAQNDTVRTGSAPKARPGLFGDFSLGISNYGMAGELKGYYRFGNKLVSAGYYQSHVCYAGEYNGIPFWRSGSTTTHVSIYSWSALFGIRPHGRWNQGLSAGLSISRIKNETTEPIVNDLSIGGVYRELAGDGFDDRSHGTCTTIALGLPIEYKVFLFDTRSIGLDLAARVDLNRTLIFSSITLGMRVGK